MSGTIIKQGKVIRDMLKMEYFDDEFSTEHMKQNNLYKNLVMVNGFIVGIESLPPEVREELRVENQPLPRWEWERLRVISDYENSFEQHSVHQYFLINRWPMAVY